MNRHVFRAGMTAWRRSTKRLLPRRSAENKISAASFSSPGAGVWLGDRGFITDIRTNSNPLHSHTTRCLSSSIQVSSKKKGTQVRVCYGCGADIVPKNRIIKEEDSTSRNASSNNKKSESSAYQVKSSDQQDGDKKKGKSYWAEQRKLLRKSQIKNWGLCPRCKALSRPGAVQNLGFAPGAAVKAFREQVQQVRRKHAVVVFVVDAINTAGTIFRTLREYVGGNPIVLAVTRCDLLPDYTREDLLRQGNEHGRIKREFAQRAKDLNVAEVFLISLPPNQQQKKPLDEEDWDSVEAEDDYDNHRQSDSDNDRSNKKEYGVSQLAAALLDKRMDRDVYVVGAANIGKSTLTDALVDELIAQQSVNAFRREYQSARRVDAIREMRVTQSALPGTTLQNVRVPCFLDHQQALWDTPGLILDQVRHHFPIRNLEQMLRSAPKPIKPVELQTGEKRFMVELYDKVRMDRSTSSSDDVDNDASGNEPLPLLRMVVRLKRDKTDNQKPTNDDPTNARIVWHSVFGLYAKIVDYVENPTHVISSEEPSQPRDWTEKGNDGMTIQEEEAPLTPKEKAARKEEKRKAYQARIRAEQKELGMDEWKRQENEKQKATEEQMVRAKLARFHPVHRTEINAGEGTDIAIENLGWFGFLCDRDALVQVYAPSSGASVSTMPALSLPSWWDWEKKGGSDADGDEDDVWDDDDAELFAGEDLGWGSAELFAGDDLHGDHDGWGSVGWDTHNDWDSILDDDFALEEPESHRAVSDKDFPDDPWGSYAGSSVGWEFVNDVRFSKTIQFDGWHPINKETPEKAVKGDPHWKPPIQEHYHVEYPKYAPRQVFGRRQTNDDKKQRKKPRNIKPKSKKANKRQRGSKASAW